MNSPTPDLGALADELGALEKEYAVALAQWDGKVERMAQLRKKLEAACTAKPKEIWTAEGQKFGVRFGPCALLHKINYAKLAKLIGLRAYAKIATVTLKSIRQHVPAPAGLQVITSSQTGARHMTLFEKGTAGAAGA